MGSRRQGFAPTGLRPTRRGWRQTSRVRFIAQFIVVERSQEMGFTFCEGRRSLRDGLDAGVRLGPDRANYAAPLTAPILEPRLGSRAYSTTLSPIRRSADGALEYRGLSRRDGPVGRIGGRAK